jgi:hypothetical protein
MLLVWDVSGQCSALVPLVDVAGGTLVLVFYVYDGQPPQLWGCIHRGPVSSGLLCRMSLLQHPVLLSRLSFLMRGRPPRWCGLHRRIHAPADLAV